MLRIIFIIIIIVILIKEYFDESISPNENFDTQQKQNNYETSKKLIHNSTKKIKFETFDSNNNESNKQTDKQSDKQTDKQTDKQLPIKKMWEFPRPDPWTKILLDNTLEYPYQFFIKVKIASLNDFQAWKQVVPNIDFNPASGELIIPSKNEASALALANLIITNFVGQLTIQNILDKQLINISINSALNNEEVQNKLRENISNNLSLESKKIELFDNPNKEKFSNNDILNNNFNKPKSNENFPIEKPNGKIDFTSDHFKDTFQHFGETNTNNNDIEPFDNSSYSFL